ncbi:hypothetical protein BDN70DRAFT_898740 [Pholiota conissans]|uniref:Uncharacterized protein n=1 Tax=Pholiota conissans TaxID=109636 RepID=A0A9P5YTA6_9AGAR|nr:hypothetical protein BDN70DRAFT_898740 [Pholiota conissans]
MHFNTVFTSIATALLTSSSLAMAVIIIGFTGPDCTGAAVGTSVPSGECFPLGGIVKSILYSNVPKTLELYTSNNANSNTSCVNGSGELFDGGSGCVTAPVGQLPSFPCIHWHIFGEAKWLKRGLGLFIGLSMYEINRKNRTIKNILPAALEKEDTERPESWSTYECTRGAWTYSDFFQGVNEQATGGVQR